MHFDGSFLHQTKTWKDREMNGFISDDSGVSVNTSNDPHQGGEAMKCRPEGSVFELSEGWLGDGNQASWALGLVTARMTHHQLRGIYAPQPRVYNE